MTDLERISDLLKLSLGGLLRIPYGVAEKGSEEFDRFWTILDPAHHALFHALEALDPDNAAPSAEGSPELAKGEVSPSVDQSSTVPFDAKNELERVNVLLREAVRLLAGVAMLDDSSRVRLTARCQTADGAVREAIEYVSRT
jgi:hypothetical protein